MMNLPADSSEELQVQYGTIRRANSQEQAAYRTLTGGGQPSMSSVDGCDPSHIVDGANDDEDDDDDNDNDEELGNVEEGKSSMRSMRRNGLDPKSSMSTRGKPANRNAVQVAANDSTKSDSCATTKPSRVSLLEDKNDDSGRRKIRIEFIDDDSRRHVTFSKRKTGIMKKAYELATLTGTQVLLLIVSQSDQVFTFATPKLQPIVMEPQGQGLIQTCLSQPDEIDYDASYSQDGGLSDEADTPCGVVGSETPKASRISIQSARRRSVAKNRSDALRTSRLGSVSSMSTARSPGVMDDMASNKRQRIHDPLGHALTNDRMGPFPEMSSSYPGSFASAPTHDANELNSNDSASGSDHSSRLSAYSSPDMYRTSSIALASPPLQTLSLYNQYSPHQEQLGHYTPYQAIENQGQRVQLHDQQQRIPASHSTLEDPRPSHQQQYNQHYNLSPTSTSSISGPPPATFYQHMVHPGTHNQGRGYGIETFNAGS